MRYKIIFGESKPIIGMIHLNSTHGETVLDRAKKEIEIYFRYGIYPLVENYFGSTDDCEEVLEWLATEHHDKIYGVNILGNYRKAFELAVKYNAKFIQIDSVCGHLPPDEDMEYGISLNNLRKENEIVLLGGVRFKYCSVLSGRSVEEDLRIGMSRCDAIVCTGTGTGCATPFDKVDTFKEVLGDFPVITGAGVTIETAEKTMKHCDGFIIGSWLKHNHCDTGFVCEENVACLYNLVGNNGNSKE